MKIGLLSDTHGFLDPAIFHYLEPCDELWHAGDIGDAGVADKLAALKPLRAVYGNIDGPVMQQRFPEDLWFVAEGLTVWMTHIGGNPPHYNPRVKKILRERLPDIFICGHSHILRIGRDQQHNNMLYINPGAVGNQGFHPMKTIVRFEILGRDVRAMEVIELGKRGQLTT